MALRRRIVSEEDACGHDGRYCSPPYPPSPLPGIPTPPPAVLSPPPPSTPIQISNKNHALPLVVVVVASVLAVCLLFLAYYAVHRYRSSRRRRRRLAAAAWGPPQPPSDAEGDLLREDLLVGGGGVEDPYHVWYIRTAGLEQAVIGAIAVCEYRKGEGLVEGADCAVCLGEFADGEPLRLLPKCSHAFHVPCIDTWLRSHVNCPLCRAPILAPVPHRPPPPMPTPAVGSVNLGSEVALVAHGTPQATAEGDSLGDVNSEEDRNASAVLPPTRVGVDCPALGASFSSEESDIWVPIDLGDGGLGDELASCAAPVERDLDGELQPVRRSVSMDSSALAGLLLRMWLAGLSRDGGRKPCVGEDAPTNKKGRTGENNRKGASMLDAPLEMGRCMSGGRFVLSRFSSRARGAILPL